MFGVAAEIISLKQMGAIGLFAGKQAGGIDGGETFENRYANDLLTGKRGPYQSEAGGAGTDGAKDMGIICGIYFAKDGFAAGDARYAAAAFRDDIYAGETVGELLQEDRLFFVRILSAGEELEPHAIASGFLQGIGECRRPFSSDHTDGLESRFACGVCRRDQVVRPCAAKGKDGGMVGGQLKMTMQLEPFIS